jgi:hypothetical protein
MSEAKVMAVDSANRPELVGIAAEIGTDILQGALRHPSDTSGWQLGDLDLSEYLDRYRDQRLVLIIAPVGLAATETYACGICGFVRNGVEESHREAARCPRWPKCPWCTVKGGHADGCA